MVPFPWGANACYWSDRHPSVPANRWIAYRPSLQKGFHRTLHWQSTHVPGTGCSPALHPPSFFHLFCGIAARWHCMWNIPCPKSRMYRKKRNKNTRSIQDRHPALEGKIQECRRGPEFTIASTLQSLEHILLWIMDVRRPREWTGRGIWLCTLEKLSLKCPIRKTVSLAMMRQIPVWDDTGPRKSTESKPYLPSHHCTQKHPPLSQQQNKGVS